MTLPENIKGYSKRDLITLIEIKENKIHKGNNLPPFIIGNNKKLNKEIQYIKYIINIL